jgi:hypothetical protein
MIVIPFVAGDEGLAEGRGRSGRNHGRALIKEEGTSLALLFGGAIFVIKKGTLQLSECPDAQAFRDMQAKNQANKTSNQSYTGAVAHGKDDDVNYYGHTYMAANETISDSDWFFDTGPVKTKAFL